MDFRQDPDEDQVSHGEVPPDANYEVDFNFDGYKHQDLIDRNLNMQCFLQTYTSKECVVCHPIIQQIYMNQLTQSNEPLRPVKKLQDEQQIQQIAYDNLNRKYMTSKDFYQVKIVNDIIYNEPTHIVAVFKDYLIYDDLSEFLKRYYEGHESIARLPKICDFYEKNSKVFPNYVNLPESKFMYKNIERKQKIIDDKIRYQQDKQVKKEEKIKKRIMKGAALGKDLAAQELLDMHAKEYESSMSWLQHSLRFFDSKFMDSVMNQEILYANNTQHQSFIQRSQVLDQSIRQTGKSKLNRNFADLNLESLVQAFVTKDSNKLTTNHSNVTATLDITMPSFHQKDDSEKFLKAIALQQQQQREQIMKQMKERKESQNRIITQSLNPGKQDGQFAGQFTNALNQNQPTKFLFTSNAMNPYLKQQKFFEKIKTDQKKKSPGSSIANSPQTQSKPKIASPPKAQKFQQIYGAPIIPKPFAKQVNGSNQELKANNQGVRQIKKPILNLKHQLQDFKIRFSQKIQGNNPFALTVSGSLTQRDLNQKRLINNLVNGQDFGIQNQFSPLEIKDQSASHRIQFYRDEQRQTLTGSQSARVLNNQELYQKYKSDNTTQSASSKVQVKIPSATIQNSPYTSTSNFNFGSSVFEYKAQPLHSMKHGGKSLDKNKLKEHSSLSNTQKGQKPQVVQRIDNLLRQDSKGKSTLRRKSSNRIEESKHVDMSNTLGNQSNNLQNHSETHQQQQQSQFMVKRNLSKQESISNINQVLNQVQHSSSISHANSGFNTQSAHQILQHTSNSSNNTNNIMRVLPIDANDISTNLNNNSRNFLARQQQQQIQLQKQSRGVNPRQKSVPKSKGVQRPVDTGSPSQFTRVQGDQQQFAESYVQPFNPLLHTQMITQVPSTARGQQIPHFIMDQGSIMNHLRFYPGSVVSSANQRFENPLVQNTKQIIKKVMKNSQQQKKSNSQNRGREPSPVNNLANTVTQPNGPRINLQRRSLDRPQQIGLQNQHQVAFSSIQDPRDSGAKMYDFKSNHSPIIVDRNQSSKVQDRRNSKKIVIVKKPNIILGKVGHQRVGKTSIINRFINDNFNDDEGESKTFQIQKKMLKIDKTDKWAQLHIWDTLGQENYKSLSPLFFRKSIGAFLVFDCTSMESFREIDSWFEQMSNSVDSKVLIMMLGNKCDLPHREVPYNYAMEYARKRNFGFLEVSAKTGLNIKNAFNGLIREIYRSANPQKEVKYEQSEKPDKNMSRPKFQSIRLQSEVHVKKSKYQDTEEDEDNNASGDGKKGKKSNKKRSRSDDSGHKDRCFKCN